MLDGAPPGAEATTTDSGWVNSQKFLEWLQMFVQKVRPTEDHKALLILDNHESHKSYDALDFATKNNVVFLSIPPHTSHKLQPLDVAIYRPIKKFFEIEVNSFQKQHPGRIINQYDIRRLFTAAYFKGAVPANAISGFRASGIYPFNRHIIGDEHFEPSEVYVRNAASIISEAIFSNINEPNSNMNQTNEPNTNMNQPNETNTNKNQTNEPNTNMNETGENCIENRGAENTNENLNMTGEGNISNADLLQNIRPIPIEIVKKNIMPGRKPQQSEILTSTPIKTTQKQKRDVAAAKKRCSFDSPGPSSNKKKTRTKRSYNTDTVHSKSSYLCTVCKEKYIHPPIEDWIQCGACQEWSHEACSSYSGRGSYFCDECFD